MSDATASAWVFHGTTIVKPLPVIFGGIQADAIEIMSGPWSGVYVRCGGAHDVNWLASDVNMYDRPVQIGILQCDGCRNQWRFARDGRVLRFPFEPMPGWMAWSPSSSAAAGAEPRRLTCRVLCDRCATRMDAVISYLFQNGHS